MVGLRNSSIMIYRLQKWARSFVSFGQKYKNWISHKKTEKVVFVREICPLDRTKRYLLYTRGMSDFFSSITAEGFDLNFFTKKWKLGSAKHYIFNMISRRCVGSLVISANYGRMKYSFVHCRMEDANDNNKMQHRWQNATLPGSIFTSIQNETFCAIIRCFNCSFKPLWNVLSTRGTTVLCCQKFLSQWSGDKLWI